ncbi:MAG: hypothetical protein A3F11_07450 [Gammaproteobacteria bacterium RIFCSPHIGHO2_12_FULL_37_14]|nr:MAG: hypothetical protein A3F11_07450 [Gammaproteobacteria bacterium RIFCSPHIGHO2_12_FULL_37_14]
MRYLITGGSGYFGGELKRSLLKDGHICINVDTQADSDQHPNLIHEQIDISNPEALEAIFKKHAPFAAVFHAAAHLQLTRKTYQQFYATNITATRYLAENCVRYQISHLIFISSNCVYGRINGMNITEESPLIPFEEYGKTKVVSEKILQEFSNSLHSICLRPPTIIGEGRMGVLSIVFDFIYEGRKLWLIGSGENRYQFIYSEDLIQACKLAVHYPHSAVFNVGCDHVPTLNELFLNIIQKTNSKTRLFHLSPTFFIPAMKLFFKLGLSPLGPYQYNMIANTYIGDTSKIKRELNWHPTKSNIEIMVDNYNYYIANRIAIKKSKMLTGHRRVGRAGILSLIKWMS